MKQKPGSTSRLPRAQARQSVRSIQFLFDSHDDYFETAEAACSAAEAMQQKTIADGVIMKAANAGRGTAANPAMINN